MNEKAINPVRKELSEAINEVRVELLKCHNGLEAIDSEEMLLSVINALETMISGLEKTVKPAPPGLWRIITDTWPYDNPLSEKIIKAEYLYKHLGDKNPH